MHQHHPRRLQLWPLSALLASSVQPYGKCIWLYHYCGPMGWIAPSGPIAVPCSHGDWYFTFLHMHSNSRYVHRPMSVFSGISLTCVTGPRMTCSSAVSGLVQRVHCCCKYAYDLCRVADGATPNWGLANSWIHQVMGYCIFPFPGRDFMILLTCYRLRYAAKSCFSMGSTFVQFFL